MMTLAQMCAEALRRDPAQPAIEFAGEWVSWGQLGQLADQLYALIASSGIADSAPVVLVSFNRPPAAAALLAVLAQGRSVRMVYGFQSAAAIARELAALKPALVIAAAEVFSAAVTEALRALGAAAIALGGMVAEKVVGLERCTSGSGSGSEAAPEIQILTSGTTGAPKRIGISHEMIARHFVGANKNYQAAEDLSRAAPMFSYYPLGNISGIYGLIPPLLRGHRVVWVERFSVAAWRDYLQRHKPERGSLPPAGFQMVLDADVPAEELACLRCVASGAAPLALDVHRAFEAKYNVPILMSYGATEFGGPVTSMTLELHAQWGQQKLGSAGRPIAGSQLRVVDPESGAQLSANEEGILEVMTPRIGEHWLRTSDLAVIDADGFLFHRGRADGAIMRGGFKVLPDTVERALLLHPAVAAAAVVGMADPRLGQVPAVAIQTKLDVPRPSASDLEQHLRAHTFATHIPAAWQFVEQLPRTASMKVDYSAVRELFQPAHVSRT
jgi:acyl-coenzyme A synthetase/AMP-(fatty) acid ligase